MDNNTDHRHLCGQIPERNIASVYDDCALGQWIHGDGWVSYESVKEFAEPKEKHRQFHITVGQVIDRLQSGKIDEAKVEITSGKFRQISGEIINLLSKLRRSIQ